MQIAPLILQGGISTNSALGIKPGLSRIGSRTYINSVSFEAFKRPSSVFGKKVISDYIKNPQIKNDVDNSSEQRFINDFSSIGQPTRISRLQQKVNERENRNQVAVNFLIQDFSLFVSSFGIAMLLSYFFIQNLNKYVAGVLFPILFTVFRTVSIVLCYLFNSPKQLALVIHCSMIWTSKLFVLLFVAFLDSLSAKIPILMIVILISYPSKIIFELSGTDSFIVILIDLLMIITGVTITIIIRGNECVFSVLGQIAIAIIFLTEVHLKLNKLKRNASFFKSKFDQMIWVSDLLIFRSRFKLL